MCVCTCIRLSVLHCESVAALEPLLAVQHRDEQVHTLESKLAEVSKEACMDRELRKEAEASAQTFKEQYESREKEIDDLKMALESVRATLNKTADDLEGRVKEKEQELYEKEFQLCNMEVGSCDVGGGGCIYSCGSVFNCGGMTCVEVALLGCWSDGCILAVGQVSGRCLCTHCRMSLLLPVTQWTNLPHSRRPMTTCRYVRPPIPVMSLS